MSRTSPHSLRAPAGLTLLILLLLLSACAGSASAPGTPPQGASQGAPQGASQGASQAPDLAKMLSQAFPGEHFYRIEDGWFVDSQKQNYYPDPLVPGAFTASGEKELLLTVRRPGRAHAEGLYHLYAAVFNGTGDQLRSDVLHLAGDEGAWALFEGQGVSHLFFVGSVTYNGWTDFHGGLYQARPTWTQTWPADPDFWQIPRNVPGSPSVGGSGAAPGQAARGDRKVEIGPGELKVYERRILGTSNPGQTIPDYTFEYLEILRWNPERASFEPQP